MFEGLIEWIMSIIATILSWFGYSSASSAADVEAKVELLPPVIPSAPVELPTDIVA